jgi:hypothetical protein
MFRSLLAERLRLDSGGPSCSFGGLLSVLIIVDYGRPSWGTTSASVCNP